MPDASGTAVLCARCRAGAPIAAYRKTATIAGMSLTFQEQPLSSQKLIVLLSDSHEAETHVPWQSEGSGKVDSKKITTGDLNKALHAYIAHLPLREAITFAAGVWGVSFEEALRRLRVADSPQALESKAAKK